MQWEAIIKALEKMEGTPLLLVFAAVFIAGWMLKNYSPLNNKLIPWVLLVIGIVFSLLLNGITLAYGIIGAIIAWLCMAFYENIKNTLEYMITNKKE